MQNYHVKNEFQSIQIQLIDQPDPFIFKSGFIIAHRNNFMQQLSDIFIN